MKKLLFITILLGILLSAGIVLAAPCTLDGAEVCLDNPIGETDIPTIFGNMIRVVTGIMGSLALIVFIFGGFMWMTAGGNADKVKKGTTAMLWAVIGIVVIFSSYAIIKLVLDGLGVTEYTPPPQAFTDQNSSQAGTCVCNIIDGSPVNPPQEITEYSQTECAARVVNENVSNGNTADNTAGGFDCVWVSP